MTTDDLKPGDKHYRAFVGPPEGYDIMAAIQFNLLTALGLRDTHHVLDIGCGSLRVGRLLIPYLRTGRYYGLEPEEWLVREGIESEVGQDLVRIKKPSFAYNSDFDLSGFRQMFDFVLAQSVFSHASERQIVDCLRAVGERLQPSGIFAATFVLGSDDYRGTEWAYPACIRYTEAGMKRIVESAGMTMRIIEWPHPEQVWMLICHSGAARRLRDPVSAQSKLDPTNVVIDEFVDSAHGWGYVDEVRIEGRRITVRGWSRNADTNQPAKDVLILTQDRQVVASTVAWIPRNDVAEHFHEPTLAPCGFLVSFDIAALPAGHHRLSACTYLSQGRKAIRLPSGPNVQDAVISKG